MQELPKTLFKNYFSQALLGPTLLSILSLALTACNFVQYQPKPISIGVNASRIEKRDPNSNEFLQYLIINGYNANHLPIKEWDAEDLTYVALFFHSSLDVARAEWHSAEDIIGTAGAKPVPTINTTAANRTRANIAKSPYAFGFSIDIPIETANKRDIRLENAQHLSLAAKLKIAQTAWELRNQVALSLNEYEFNQQQNLLITTEQAQRAEIVAIYQKRVDLGEASKVELSTANLLLQSTNAALQSNEQNRLVLISNIAKNLGLSMQRVESMKIITHNNTQLPFYLKPDLESSAVFNRLDLRIALEKYAAAESKLKLEIAKQYPNIIISPGYAYELGDKVWSLGLSSLLSLLNKNKVAISEATQLREVEAAQVDALQSKIIADASMASAKAEKAHQELVNQQSVVQKQQQHTQKMFNRLAAGEIDRLEMTFAQLELNASEKNLAFLHYQLKLAEIELENTLQKPLAQTTINLDVEALSLKSIMH